MEDINPSLKESRGQHGHQSWCLGSPALIGSDGRLGENGFCIVLSSEIHGFDSAGPGHLLLSLPCAPLALGRTRCSEADPGGSGFQ